MPHATSRLLGALVVMLAAAATGCAADNAPTNQHRAYERYVRDLSSGSPDKARAAWSALSDAEMDAFPTRRTTRGNGSEAIVAANPTNGDAPHCVEFLRERDAKLAR